MTSKATTAPILRIGTRGSPLALAQAQETRDRLAAADPNLAAPGACEILVVKTTGDRVRDRALAEVGGKGLFVKELEAGLLDAAEALHHEDRHIVSNLLGLEPMSVEIGSPVAMAAFDTALIASDGLYDNLYLAEIIEVMRKGALTDACAALAAQARSRMLHTRPGEPCKPDDLSVVLLRRTRG